MEPIIEGSNLFKIVTERKLPKRIDGAIPYGLRVRADPFNRMILGVIKKRRELGEAREIAMVDELSWLSNLRYFHHRIVEEMEQIRQHPVLAVNILEPLEGYREVLPITTSIMSVSPSSSFSTESCLPITFHHHEHYEGWGLPEKGRPSTDPPGVWDSVGGGCLSCHALGSTLPACPHPRRGHRGAPAVQWHAVRP